MVNVENVNKVISVIKTLEKTCYNSPDGFSMKSIYHDCGTPACILGYVNSIMLNEDKETSPNYLKLVKETNVFYSSITYEIMDEWMGIAETQHEELYYPALQHVDYTDVTPEDAVKVLKNLKETGVVNWGLIDRPTFKIGQSVTVRDSAIGGWGVVTSFSNNQVCLRYDDGQVGHYDIDSNTFSLGDEDE